VDPVTLMMMAGQGLSMFGQHESIVAQTNALKSQEQQAIYNAQSARLKGIADAELYAIQAQKLIAGQKGEFTAGGVSGGSAMAVMADSRINAEMDRLNIIFGGNLRSAQFMSEAQAKHQGAKDLNKAGLFQTLAGGFGMAGLAQQNKVGAAGSGSDSGGYAFAGGDSGSFDTSGMA
jgi:hypothetical protein